MIQNLPLPLEEISAEKTWMDQEFRKQALRDFDTIGFPNVRSEDWKYTPISRFLPESYLRARPIENDEPEIRSDYSNFSDYLPFKDIDTYNLVFLNGIFHEELSELASEDAFEVIPIHEAANDLNFMNYFRMLEKADKNPFSKLNTSEYDRGIFIKIKSGKIVKKPIHILRFFSGPMSTMIHSRSLILADSGSESSFIESYVSNSTTDLFFNGLTETFLKDNARVENIRFQNMGGNTRLLISDLVGLHKNSQYRSHTYSLSGKLIRNNLQINLLESQAEAHLYGFYSIQEEQLMDNHTLVRHLKPNCESTELYKGVLHGKSIGVFNGRVEVSKDAQKTNAYQQNQTILLGKEATMNSKPELEIFADDVKCSHGSTIGQMDKQALFYLQSRGISEASAQKMMVNAFADAILSKISSREVREEIGNQIQQSETHD
jgi:Fe-S cluster assembly protein SufD